MPGQTEHFGLQAMLAVVTPGRIGEFPEIDHCGRCYTREPCTAASRASRNAPTLSGFDR